MAKYLGIAKTKRQDTCTLKNHKTLLKVTEEDTNTWKDISCS